MVPRFDAHTTDFFEREEQTRRQTRRLVLMFAAEVAAAILLNYGFLLCLVAGIRECSALISAVAPPRAASAAAFWWNPTLLVATVLGTFLVIAAAVWYKKREFAAGGEAVAMKLGARAVTAQTTDLAERQLFNVVEEMALASGIPVPMLYVLDNEPGINALAAGHRPADAVLVVTRGSLDYLTREEIEGVMAHEFSQIVNGDIGLNLRLTGMVFCLGFLAILLGNAVSSRQSPRGGNKSAGLALLLLTGLMILAPGLVIMSFFGWLLGALTQGAICRQREYLADAFALQFTREPAGIVGTLKKIGGLPKGSQIDNPQAEELGHMFFGATYTVELSQPSMAHPPLVDRIRALEPTFNGRFPEVRRLAVTAETAEEASRRRTAETPLHRAIPVAERVPGPVEEVAHLIGKAMGRSSSRHLETLARIGRPRAADACQAGRLLESMPPALADSAREPSTASAVVFALVLARDDDATRARQLQLLQAQIEPALYDRTQQLAVAAGSLDAAARLPLVQLTIPALKRSTSREYAAFRQVVEALVGADGRIDLFEYCLRTLLFDCLDVFFRLKKTPAVRFRTTSEVAKPLAAVLSTLAYVGQQAPGDIQRAFQAGADGLGQLAILPKDRCKLAMFDAALSDLALTSPFVKRDIITAVTACILADGCATVEEGELLRVIAAVLSCPMPPMPADCPS